MCCWKLAILWSLLHQRLNQGIFETREYLWQKHQTGSGRNTQSFCKQFKMIRPILSESDRADRGWRGTVSPGHLGAVRGTHKNKTVQLYVLIWMRSSQNDSSTIIQIVFWTNWLMQHLDDCTSTRIYCSYYHQLVQWYCCLLTITFISAAFDARFYTGAAISTAASFQRWLPGWQPTIHILLPELTGWFLYLNYLLAKSE